jgi:hypothetical protein
MPTSLPNQTDEDQRTHRRWGVSVLAAYAILLAALFGVLSVHPHAVELASDVVQTEFAGSKPSPAAIPVQLAARKATVK